MKGILLGILLLLSTAAARAQDITLPFTIAVITNQVRLRWETPAAGSFYLEASTDLNNWTVLESDYSSGPIHAAFTMPRESGNRFFRLIFKASSFR